MFKLATCNEFIELRKKYPEVVDPFNDKLSWGLKMYGYLSIYDQILKLKPQKVLEVGAGLNLLFFYLLGKKLEYWMVDDGSLYPDPAQFREKLSIMNGVHFVNSLLGYFPKELPDNYFDMIFSISVLEHTPLDPPTAMENVCKDMYRLLKPGGFIVHTIDITPNSIIGHRYLDFMKQAGFILCEEPMELDWDVSKQKNQVLLERLDTTYLYYYEKHLKSNLPIVYFHFSTIFVMAFKPAK
jgi:ubiquinone/menaquinone biosynthesis C-methylase UbiE